MWGRKKVIFSGIEEAKTYKFFRYSNTAEVMGVITLQETIDNLEEEGFLTFDVDRFSQMMISGFEEGKIDYMCNGQCYCENTERRSLTSGHILGRGLVYLVSAASAAYAMGLARDYFNKECEYEFKDDCPPSQIRSEVDMCSEIVKGIKERYIGHDDYLKDVYEEFDDEAFKEVLDVLVNDIFQVMYRQCAERLVFGPPKDGGNDYGKYTRTYNCEGKCKDSPHYQFDDELRFIMMSDECFREFGPDWVHVQCRDISDEDCMEKSRQKFFDIMVSPICGISSIAEVEGWKKVGMCVGDYDTVECEPAEDDPVPTKRPIIPGPRDEIPGEIVHGCCILPTYPTNKDSEITI